MRRRFEGNKKVIGFSAEGPAASRRAASYLRVTALPVMLWRLAWRGGPRCGVSRSRPTSPPKRRQLPLRSATERAVGCDHRQVGEVQARVIGRAVADLEA